MNIIENKKRIVVLGSGTAGCTSVATFNHFSPQDEIIWYTSPNIPAQSVGEGTTLGFPYLLKSTLDLTFLDINKFQSTLKKGSIKLNWGGNNKFFHGFSLGQVGIHFNAVEFQKFVVEHLKPYIKLQEKHINNYNEIDSDYIIDCTGKNLSKDLYHTSPYTPVNSAYITQCYWDVPKFDYTLAIARPYGWVFIIPLQNRCSVGYLYNKNINKTEEIIQDVQNIFIDYNLTPSNNTSNLFFNNYYRKENYTKRVFYNGNSSFFLEPLEATSIANMLHINENIFNIIYKNQDIEKSNKIYINQMKEIQFMLMLHYLNGNKFNTPFWKQAKDKALKCIKEDTPPSFNKIYQKSKEYFIQNRIHFPNPNSEDRKIEFGTWSIESWNLNLKELDLYPKLDKLLNI